MISDPKQRLMELRDEIRALYKTAEPPKRDGRLDDIRAGIELLDSKAEELGVSMDAAAEAEEKPRPGFFKRIWGRG